MESPGLDDPLGDAGEQEWSRLRAQIELSEGFWLGFVFSPSPRSVVVLREWTEYVLQSQTTTIVLVRPETPEGLREVLPFLLETPEPTHAGCTWVEAVRADPPGALEQPWLQAYDELFLRMNERRDALRTRLHGGLVFALPPHIKPRVRDAAPDLWSVRAIVLELPSMQGAEVREDSPVAPPAPSSNELPSPDPDFALAEAERRKARGSLRTQALSLMWAARGFLAQERHAEALEAAKEAWGLLRNEGGSDEANALALLAEAEEMTGALDVAEQHFGEAISGMRRVGADTVPFDWLQNAGKLALRRGDLDAALRLQNEAVSMARRRFAKEGGTPAALRDLALALMERGVAEKDGNALASAVQSLEESLALARRRATLGGHDEEASRDLAMVLDNVGAAKRDAGDVAGAAAAFAEALALFERMESPDVALHLNKLALLLRDMGKLDEALDKAKRALAVGQSKWGDDDPHVANLHSNLASLLVEIALQPSLSPEQREALRRDARTHLERALEIGVQVHGEDHYVVAIRRNNLGLLLKDLGDVRGARRQLEEAVGIARKVLRPDHPRVKKLENNLAVILGRRKPTL